MSENVLGQSSLFWVRQKTAYIIFGVAEKNVMPAQKLNSIDIIFWPGTIFLASAQYVIQFLVKKILSLEQPKVFWDL